MPESPVRVVLANDDRIIVEGLRSMLAPYDDVVVVGTAEGEPEIVMAPDTEQDADVMLIDAFHRRAAGMEAAMAVLAQEPPFAVAVFTHADDLRLVLQALRVGVRGYLLKSATPGGTRRRPEATGCRRNRDRAGPRDRGGAAGRSRDRH
jgi:DNA-binding NarL/FixJ family response regulator